MADIRQDTQRIEILLPLSLVKRMKDFLATGSKNNRFLPNTLSPYFENLVRNDIEERYPDPEDYLHLLGE